MPGNQALRRLLVGVARTSPGRRVLAAMLADDAVLRDVLNSLSDRLAAESPFRERPAGDAAHGTRPFEDCVHLLSSNVINHGVSRLMIDEAAYLYRLIRSLDRPSVVEIGRHRGGTTFLLAAAGARVLSVDLDPVVAEHDRLLVQELEQARLAGQVDLAIGDSRTFSVDGGPYDVVFVDGDHSYEGARADVEHWLPAVAPGGHLVLHDARIPQPRRPWTDPWKVEGTHRVCAELLDDDRLALAGSAGTIADFVRVEQPPAASA